MRADPWILSELPELLVTDWYDLHIYTEYEMQVATYHHLRRSYANNAEQWRFRTQPRMSVGRGADVKPDIVLYKGTMPYDAIEMKCMLDGFAWTRLEPDLEKLRRLKDNEGLRHAYLLVLYDDEDQVALGPKDDWMKNYLTFVGASIQHHASGRRRSRYEAARRRWEAYYR